MTKLRVEESEPKPWRERLRELVTSPEFATGFVIAAAAAAVGYVAGYRDGARDR